MFFRKHSFYLTAAEYVGPDGDLISKIPVYAARTVEDACPYKDNAGTYGLAREIVNSQSLSSILARSALEYTVIFKKEGIL